MHLIPLKRRAFNIKHPDVALSLLPIVATKNDQQGLVENHGVAIAPPWRWT
jgi:hypothetical protein